MANIRSVKVLYDGIVFDSIGEKDRYIELRLLERGGAIRNLEVHPVYINVINGIEVGRCTPDFRYERRQKNGSYRLVVEDYKSDASDTEACRLRYKVTAAIHGFDKVEIHNPARDARTAWAKLQRKANKIKQVPINAKSKNFARRLD